MNILIFGGSGFLGRHLIQYLQAMGHQVLAPTSREVDLTGDALSRWDPRIKFDRIYHLAAWTRAGEFCSLQSGEQWIINQQINTNILAYWARHHPLAHMIAFGTSVSYPKEASLTEENYLSGLPIDRFYGYAMCKRMLLVGLETLSRQYNLRYFYGVPSTLYGPTYHLDGRPLHFIYDLIRKIVRGQRFGEPVVLWGDGYQKRELVYVDDFIANLEELISNVRNEVVNLGAGREYSIRDFASIISEQIGFDPALIQYDTERYTGAKSKILDISKANRLSPAYRSRPLLDGLQPTINWALESGLID